MTENPNAPATVEELTMISRAAAIEVGLKRYYTGLPCRFGHVSERLCSNGTCIACLLLKKREWHSKNSARLAEAKKEKRVSDGEKIRAAQRASYLKNKEKANERTRKYYANNKDAVIKKQKEWRLKNIDIVKNAAKVWAVVNIQKVRAIKKSYKIRHPEAERAYGQNRRARKRAGGGRLSKDLVKKLFALQKGRCACCRAPLGKDYHLDHIAPLSKGGINIDENIQLLKARCNVSKGAKDPIEYMQNKGFLL